MTKYWDCTVYMYMYKKMYVIALITDVHVSFLLFLDLTKLSLSENKLKTLPPRK